jgi:hypothetical protein
MLGLFLCNDGNCYEAGFLITRAKDLQFEAQVQLRRLDQICYRFPPSPLS